MIVGVPRESYPGERRVALVPSVIPALAKGGLEVIVEANAGLEAGYPDSTYIAKGTKIIRDRAELFRTADIIAQVLCYGSNDVTGKADLPLLHKDQVLIGFLRPLGGLTTVQRNRRHAASPSFSVELMPRTTRAQSMDALSSHGHHLRLQSRAHRRRHAAPHFPHADHRRRNHHPRARSRHRRGVAGLQAIATARRLGAVVFSLRHAPRRQGTGPKPGRPLRRAAHRSQGRARRRAATRGPRRSFLPAASANCSARSSPRATSSSPPPCSRQEIAACWSQKKWSTAWRRAPSSSISPPNAAVTASSLAPAKKS